MLLKVQDHAPLRLVYTVGVTSPWPQVYVAVEPLSGGLSGEHSFLPLGPFLADIPSSYQKPMHEADER